MSIATAVETGVYVYGITDAQDGLPAGLPGIDGGEMETVVADGLAAIVTRVGRQKIRAQRSNLAAHHKLLHALVLRQTVLPCAFGMVASDEEQLQELLRLNHDALADQLALLRDKVEMGLSAYWNTSNIFEFFVATNQELKEMRDRIFRGGRTPSLDEKLELGRRFESSLEQCRERHTQQVIDALDALLRRDPRRRSRPGADDYETGVPGPQGWAAAFRGGDSAGRAEVRRPLHLPVQRAVGALRFRGRQPRIGLKAVRHVPLGRHPVGARDGPGRRLPQSRGSRPTGPREPGQSGDGRAGRTASDGSEAGQIEEQDFDAEETRLLEQIEKLQKNVAPGSGARRGLESLWKTKSGPRKRKKARWSSCWTGC